MKQKKNVLKVRAFTMGRFQLTVHFCFARDKTSALHRKFNISVEMNFQKCQIFKLFLCAVLENVVVLLL